MLVLVTPKVASKKLKYRVDRIGWRTIPKIIIRLGAIRASPMRLLRWRRDKEDDVDRIG
jgi:hypothetical protein